MSWTQADLDAINTAIASGTSRVKYADREVQYRSLDELTQIRDAIRRDLGVSVTAASRRYLSHDKGT